MLNVVILVYIYFVYIGVQYKLCSRTEDESEQGFDCNYQTNFRLDQGDKEWLIQCKDGNIHK